MLAVGAHAFALGGLCVDLAAMLVAELLTLVVPHPDDGVLGSSLPLAGVEFRKFHLLFPLVAEALAVVNKVTAVHVRATALNKTGACACGLHCGASLAPMGGWDSDLACANLDSLATGLAACGPHTKLCHHAVNWACQLIALSRIAETRALLAAVDCLSHDITRPRHSSSTASLGAQTEFAPARNDAVNGTGMLVAVSGLPEVGALVAPMLGVLNNATRPAVVTLAAGLGA